MKKLTQKFVEKQIVTFQDVMILEILMELIMIQMLNTKETVDLVM